MAQGGAPAPACRSAVGAGPDPAEGSRADPTARAAVAEPLVVTPHSVERGEPVRGTRPTKMRTAWPFGAADPVSDRRRPLTRVPVESPFGPGPNFTWPATSIMPARQHGDRRFGN